MADRVVWRPDAAADLAEIVEYIALEHGLPDTALAYAERIKSRCDGLAHAPNSGRPRAELGEGIRSIAFESVVILYRSAPGLVTIVNIIHAARDYPALFKD